MLRAMIAERDPRRKFGWLTHLGLLLLVLVALPFAIYSVDRGLSMTSPENLVSRLYDAAAPVSTFAIFAHMVLGGAITVLAVLQVLPVLRRRVPALHRASGYVVAALALTTALAGGLYIAVRGTIGGWPMDAGFGVYGALMALAAVQTIRFARQRHAMHRVWATRLVILVLGSWIYRVHYGIWDLVADGAGRTPDFAGPFDLTQMVGFYLPYLLIYEVLRKRRVADTRLVA